MPPIKTIASLAISRIIAASLVGGVTAFALAAWFIVQQDGPMAAGGNETGALLRYVWATLAFGGVAAAMILWRVRVLPLLESPHHPDPESRGEALQSALVTVWALLEGPALFGVVLFLLSGSFLTCGAGLLLVWLGIGLTFPRQDWFPSQTP